MSRTVEQVAALVKAERRYATEVLVMPTPEVLPTGWAVTRHAVDDVWSLFVEPSLLAGEFPTPELRALDAILRELWQALPDDPEPRKYKPTIERTEA